MAKKDLPAYLILTALNGVTDTPAFAIDSLYIGLAHIKRSVRTHTLGLKDLQCHIVFPVFIINAHGVAKNTLLDIHLPAERRRQQRHCCDKKHNSYLYLTLFHQISPPFSQMSGIEAVLRLREI